MQELLLKRSGYRAELGPCEGFPGYDHRLPSGSTDHFLEISIADNGCGMTPEQVARAMDPFFTTPHHP